MLMRFDPFREIDRLAQSWGQGRAPVVPMDAYRDGEHFVAQLDLPGVDPASIELTVEKNALTVHAERQAAQAEGQEWLVNERPHGSFTRQLFLGEGLDSDHIEATYDRGVLSVIVPVAETAKPRKVEITAGGGAKAIEATASAA
ncbi:MAG TPA: Hsp20/alpha crystallin family protein [Acidimicrobiales bacterium]|nr:Hsp20/alpha crystallin family protein [Acidimicrobiales bacterium]